MLEMEGLLILDMKTDAPRGDNTTTENAANNAFGKAARKTLADISNLAPPKRISNENEKLQNIPGHLKQYFSKLQKENMALMHMLGERARIIELTGLEMEKLRVNMLKMQLQNQQLAHSNSQMLADLNSAKDRLKVLQHELGCKNGLLKLLKAKKVEAEDKSEMEKCQILNNEEKPTRSEERGDYFMEDKFGNEFEISKRRCMSRGSGPSKQVQSQDNLESKRLHVRRRSARFKHDDNDFKPKNDSVEINDSKRPTSQPINDLENVASGNASGNEAVELGRPSRQAAKKVQCYREIPLNVKLRRNE